MRFHELAVGDRFTFNNKEYVKIEEVRISCCKVKENCREATTNATAVLKPADNVEKLS